MKLLVIVVHPDLNQSRANRVFVDELKQDSHIIVRDLYREYPDWRIDVEKEQALLLQFDRIVFQFPFYWYSCPPLLKKWFDDVFTYGWAFGTGGDHLLGKTFLTATTIGGLEEGYKAGGESRYTIDELLRPIEQTVVRCNGTWLSPFTVYNANAVTDADLMQEARSYREYIQRPQEVLLPGTAATPN